MPEQNSCESGFIIAIILGVACTFPAHAQSSSDNSSSIWTRPRLFDYPGSPTNSLKEHGITVEGSLTQFYQGVVAGSGEHGWQYGGKANLSVTFDGNKLGLWQGFYVNVDQELEYGSDVNGRGTGTGLPMNTALAFPRVGGKNHDTSVVVTQVFNENFSVSAGKFNLVEAAAATPILGGGGANTFWNMAFACPNSGLTPPYLLGAVATLKTKPATFALMIYDPRSAQTNDVLSNPFQHGATASLWTIFPTKFGGLEGSYGLRAVYSTAKGADLANASQLLFPTVNQNAFKNRYWYFSVSAQQYFYQSADHSRGWGAFLDAGVSDGNPNAVKWHVFTGLGGTGTFDRRPNDRWGVGYFKYGWSAALMHSLAQYGYNYQDEEGLEGFYNYAITPWMQLGADVQWIRTSQVGHKNAIVTGLRLQTLF
ncbi:carbohydrate porin [Burkholderia aenigmatica]|uniref:Carbohydrate porin n=1 Tax=Burkholderia aenigmatica TaxID=2015348 RepID=A0ABY6XRI2_9BURK|nr:MULTISPECIES: carbohydrate porin [Burkholderia]VWC69555.1 carbohydrate porin [Burkholderia aenigmatica]VWC95486.1 carbohydrate porin [Burkholderia aenigmatica]